MVVIDVKENDSGVITPGGEQVEGEVTLEILKGWLNLCDLKFQKGVSVLKVTSAGKVVKGTVFINAKNQCLEVKCPNISELCVHVAEIECVKPGCQSSDFAAFKQSNDKTPDETKCCYVKLGPQIYSFIFKTSIDRRDFIFLLRTEMHEASKEVENFVEAPQRVTSKG